MALGLLADGPARTRRGDAVLLAATALAIPLNPLLCPVIFVTSASLYFLEGEEGRAAARRGAGLSFVGSALGASLAFAENLLRRGALLDFGYAGEGFTAPFFEGLFGQLFSPARGALFYLPLFFVGILLLGRRVRTDVRRFAASGTTFGVLLVLAYAKWHAWHGMTYWGPRFLLPLSVLGAAFVALAWREFPRPAGARVPRPSRRAFVRGLQGRRRRRRRAAPGVPPARRGAPLVLLGLGPAAARLVALAGGPRFDALPPLDGGGGGHARPLRGPRRPHGARSITTRDLPAGTGTPIRLRSAA